MSRFPFGKHITGIYRHLQIVINRDLKDYNIGSGQYIFLANIASNEGLNQKELSNLLKIDKTTTTKAVKKLEQEGYIYRIHDEHDRRYFNLYLTEKGKEFVPTLSKKLKDVTSILIRDMNDEQQEMAQVILQIMMKNIVEEVEKNR